MGRLLFLFIAVPVVELVLLSATAWEPEDVSVGTGAGDGLRGPDNVMQFHSARMMQGLELIVII